MTDPEKPIALVDVDGVLARFLDAHLAAVHAVTGRRFFPEDFPGHETFDIIGEAYRDDIEQEWKARGFCESLRPYPGARLGIATLRDVARVRFVTAPVHGPHWHWERTRWLERHVGARPRDIIFAHDKRVIRGDVFVDDNPDHIDSWCEANPSGRAILWTQPYNRSAKLPRNARRSCDWADVVGAARDAAAARP